MKDTSGDNGYFDIGKCMEDIISKNNIIDEGEIKEEMKKVDLNGYFHYESPYDGRIVFNTSPNIIRGARIKMDADVPFNQIKIVDQNNKDFILTLCNNTDSLFKLSYDNENFSVISNSKPYFYLYSNLDDIYPQSIQLIDNKNQEEINKICESNTGNGDIVESTQINTENGPILVSGGNFQDKGEDNN